AGDRPQPSLLGDAEARRPQPGGGRAHRGGEGLAVARARRPNPTLGHARSPECAKTTPMTSLTPHWAPPPRRVCGNDPWVPPGEMRLRGLEPPRPEEHRHLKP